MFNETTVGLGGINYTIAGLGFDYSFGFLDPGGGANPSDPNFYGTGPDPAAGGPCPSGQIYVSAGVPGCYADPSSWPTSPPGAGSTVPTGSGPDGIDWGAILQQGLSTIPATISSAMGKPYYQTYPGAGSVGSSVYNPYVQTSTGYYPSSLARPASSGLGFNISGGTLMLIVVIGLAFMMGGRRGR